MNPVILIVIVALLAVILFGAYLIIRLNKWIDQNNTGAKPYTRFTMLVAVISLVSVLIILITVLMNAYLLNDTKTYLKSQIECPNDDYGYW